jgi:hypothetical protein
MLPPDTDALRGLRAARWTRESRASQADRFGPDAQKELQDRAIERYGLADTGIHWNVQHSGTTVARTAEFQAMLAGAGRLFDVLVVGYQSRFARNLATAVNARDHMHAAGAVLLFADSGVLTSDETQWARWAREAVEDEDHNRRLGRRIHEGHAARWRRYDDPPGKASLGLIRNPANNFRIEVNSSTISTVQNLFRRYYAETISYACLGRETGLTEAMVRETLHNPIYTGIVSYLGETKIASWHADPPIGTDLFNRVAEKALLRRRSSTPRTHARHHALAGKIHCRLCGGNLKMNGQNGQGRPQRFHRCGTTTATYDHANLIAPLAAQIEQMQFDPTTITNITERLQRPATPTPPDFTLLRRHLARQHADGDVTDAEYFSRMKALRAVLVAPQQPQPYSADEIRQALEEFATTWQLADDRARARVMDTTYSDVQVEDGRIVSVSVTPEAEAIGLHYALPEQFVLARPAGIEPAT